MAKVKQEEIVDVEDDDDDEEEELCAAAACSRPIGEEVGWVQCDVCERWYHVACVGLTPERAEAMDSYNCRHCLTETGGSSTNSAAGTPTAASPESENIDVDGTTPCASSPSSPAPQVSIVDVVSTDTTEQHQTSDLTSQTVHHLSQTAEVDEGLEEMVDVVTSSDLPSETLQKGMEFDYQIVSGEKRSQEETMNS